MYVLLESVYIFMVGSRVGSSGIQFVTIQEMCVSLESVCIFEMGSSGIQHVAIQDMPGMFCRVCSRRRSGSMVDQIFLAFWSMTKPATWSHQCTTGCKETLQRHCDRVGSEVGLAPKQILLNGQSANL